MREECWEIAMSDAAQVLDRLKRRLTELRRGSSLADYAKRVQVAPQTLAEVINAEPGVYGDLTNKKASGRAGTLERIVRFANAGMDVPVELFDVLRSLGLAGHEPNVGQGLTRSVATYVSSEEVEFRTHGDIVLKEIERRRLNGDERPIKAGIYRWAPFFSPDREDVRDSFAGKLMRRLLGCLSPGRWHEPELQEVGYSTMVNTDSVRTGKLDAAFCMYEIPSRRLEGFDFIRIPGIGGTLGAVAFSFDKEVIWERIIDRDDLGATEGLRVFVIKDEVGDCFLSGSCDYREGQIQRFERSLDFLNISKGLWQHIEKQLYDRSTYTQPFLFCADVSVAQSVEKELRSLIRTEADSGIRADLNRKVLRISPDPLFSPVYPIGIAISGMATRWRDILTDALCTELFMNGGALTAKHYLEMLSLKDASSITIVQLTPDLPYDVAERFSEHVRNALKHWTGDEQRRGEIQKQWVNPFQEVNNRKRSGPHEGSLASPSDRQIAVATVGRRRGK
jgi:hypothetical protein